MKRYLGLDVGDRTIGIAVSDLLGLTAQGVETIRRTSLEKDLDRLGELMQQYETSALVSGLPKNMNGTEGDRCEIVKSFMAKVQERFPAADVSRDALAPRGRPLAQEAQESHRQDGGGFHFARIPRQPALTSAGRIG